VFVTLIAIVAVIGVSFAYFSDGMNRAVDTRGACLQVTPTLKIDKQIGDNFHQDLQLHAACLPLQYTQVEYLEFDGNSYIDTGIDQTGTISVSADFQYGPPPNAVNFDPTNALFGASSGNFSTNADDLLAFANVVDSQSPLGFFLGIYGDSSYAIPLGQLSLLGQNDGERHVIGFNDINGWMVDGVPGGNPPQGTVANNPINIYLGTMNTGGTPYDDGNPGGDGMIGKVFGFSIEKSSGGVHFVPVIDSKNTPSTADDECGMFDTVSSKFFGNSGGGTITCPTPAPNPNCDNLLCGGRNQGSTGITVVPGDIHVFTYELENTGLTDYQNYTGDRISGWIDPHKPTLISGRYLPIDYLEMPGDAYFDSGVQNNDDLSMEATFSSSDATNVSNLNLLQVQYAFGVVYGSDTNEASVSFFDSDFDSVPELVGGLGDYGFGDYISGSTILDPVAQNNVIYTAGYDTNTGWSVAIGGGASTALGGSGGVSGIVGADNIYIGDATVEGSGQSVSEATNESVGLHGKLYSFSITKPGDPVQNRKFVPVYDTVGDECGLLDTLSGSIFLSAKGNGAANVTLDTPGCEPITPPRPLLLLYPTSVSNGSIAAELNDLTANNGHFTQGTQAIAPFDGSVCNATFYGLDSGISGVCQTNDLPGTLNAITMVGNGLAYDYKFVVWAPGGIEPNTTVYFGVSAGVRGVSSVNWGQQVHPYIHS
jgi:hypothetical protein